MNLIYNKKRTNAFYALEEAIEYGGIQAVGHRMRKSGERVNWPGVSKPGNLPGGDNLID